MNTSTQPLVSIVTPVYNGAEFLGECIESVRAQTYQNWNYTIVDNCSTDGTVQLARRYASQDSRIRVQENQEFLRAIPNHNRAFRQISAGSKYCKMVFGDDWIFPECLEKMVALAEEHPSVGLVSAYALEGPRVAWTGLPYPSHVVAGRQICRQHFLEHLYVFGSATTVLYRADLVRGRDPFFNEANIHADTEACFDLLKSSDFGFVHQVLTCTRLREESLTAMSSDLQTSYGGMLQILAAHGRDYLTEAEFQSRRDEYLSDYYAFLAKSLMKGRDQKFWTYHKNKLNELGGGFSRMRLATAFLEGLGTAALEPKETLGKIFKSRDKHDPSPNPGGNPPAFQPRRRTSE
jgi:glycosyltransferase involved in cell wall biosynthesis